MTECRFLVSDFVERKSLLKLQYNNEVLSDLFDGSNYDYQHMPASNDVDMGTVVVSNYDIAENQDLVTNKNALEVIHSICYDLHIRSRELSLLLGISNKELIKYFDGIKKTFSVDVLDKLTYLKEQLEIIKSYNILRYYKYLDSNIIKYNTSLFEVLIKGENIEKYAAALKEQNAYSEAEYYRSKKNAKELDLKDCVDIYSIPYSID